jgi:hypothetical protein
MWRRGPWLAGIAMLATTGCGGATKTVTERVTAPATSSPAAVAPAPKAKAAHKRANLNNPAQQPDLSVTTPCDKAPLGHPCAASTSVDGDPNEYRQRNCDTNIVANVNTSCALAENIFWEVYDHGGRAGTTPSAVEAYSPVTRKDYEMDCIRQGSLLACESSPIGAGLFVSFPVAAINSYTSAQAAAYERSGKVGHPGPAAADSTPTREESTPEPSGGESSGPDEVGSYSHEGDQEFCEEDQCIGDFEGEGGYVVECNDGTYSHAGGISGACSDHGGENRP